MCYSAVKNGQGWIVVIFSCPQALEGLTQWLLK